MSAPGTQRLGRNQRALLELMRRQCGVYPANWRMHSRVRKQLDTLVDRGLVVNTDGVYRLVVTA